jgi:hypothetical protein
MARDSYEMGMLVGRDAAMHTRPRQWRHWSGHMKEPGLRGKKESIEREGENREVIEREENSRALHTHHRGN